MKQSPIYLLFLVRFTESASWAQFLHEFALGCLLRGETQSDMDLRQAR